MIADAGSGSERRRTLYVCGAIILAYLVFQLIGLRSIGLTDDDDFYIPAGIAYAEWLGKALTFSDGAWSQRAIDAAFQLNREHPPLAKYVFGICHFVFRGLLGPTDSARVGTVLFSTLAAALLLWLAVQHLGPKRGLRVGGLSVLALATLPRFYFHSHAATLDVPVAALYLASAAVVLRSERSTAAAWLAGPVFGLANATKLNAPFMLLAYVPFVLLIRRPLSRESGRFVLPPLPLALVSMATLGPLTFFAVWPRMWFDVVARVPEYIGFHVNHYGIHFLYYGDIYSAGPYAPWHAPFVMAGSTAPLATSALAIAGVLFAMPAIVTRIRFTHGPDDNQRREGDLLLFVVLNAVTTIGIVAFAGTPIYGGAKLFLPFFPFLCLLAGYGANGLYEGLERGLSGAAKRLVPAAFVIVACGSGLGLQARFGGYALSQYNGLVGGLRGATALGFERQYYDIAFRDLVAWLSAEAPKGLRVHFLPNNWEYVRTYKWYRRAKELRSDIQVVKSEKAATWIVLTHERRFARYASDLQRHRGAKVIKEKRVDGVPIWTVLQVR